MHLVAKMNNIGEVKWSRGWCERGTEIYFF